MIKRHVNAKQGNFKVLKNIYSQYGVKYEYNAETGLIIKKNALLFIKKEFIDLN